MTDDLTEDPLGEQCLEIRDTIRFWIAIAKEQVRDWHPAPCPPRERR
jgi:hypothetical protein